ncbi:ubiquitin carboxyl-terminal hydrolase MINDY-1-like [Actinia tenebrosa]|uniref:Ubiquitin carboxyl-terminal hydrolase n=1 Tax=Actinia tenebrosa TaxID=6105 RepID=A0A6P8IAP9_ACTTE|nr:ubiquitin carboxyl-terminal hydrolase MINDY-1-like [Actinia tenebrosa]
MADVSPREAEEETVVVENVNHSSNSDDAGDGGVKVLEKEGIEETVSADLERTEEEQSSSRSEHNNNVACSSTEEDAGTKPICKEDAVESSPENKSSNEESNLVKQEQNITSEGISDVGSLAIKDENTNREEESSIIEDIRPNSEENELSVDETQVGQKESPSTSTEPEKIQSLYHIKWMKWKGLNTPIITQNENGPCPLIAIMNALVLQRKISIPSMQEIISANQLMEYLGDCIFIQAPETLPEGAQLNYEQNMHDAIGIMSKLQTGLDVNVKFTGVTDFEFTPECVVFDLLNIKLMHGWLVDPQNVEAVKAINSLSYNQLVEKIIASKQDGADSELVSEGIAAETFLNHTATQLTYHGLCELNAQVGDEELCVFFRNNHFNTLFKHKDELFLLVTDQGFLTEDKVMWESLSNVEGDGYFVDANFKTLSTSQPVVPAAAPNIAEQPPPTAGITQEDQDYLVALTLQEEQSRDEARQSSTPPVQQPPHPTGMTTQEWSDMQLAMQLQEEEQRRQQQQQQQQHQARPVGNVTRGQVGAAAPRPNVNAASQPQGTAQQSSNEKICRIL